MGDPRYVGKNIMKICPKCGKIGSEAPEEDYPCIFCGHKTIHTEFTYAFYFNELVGTEQEDEWKQQLREKYVWAPENTDYDPDAYSQRAEEDYQWELGWERAKARSSSSNDDVSDPYACPKCGGTSFTPVRRKWSLLTGFMTNKIDMVCNRCGYVKKG